MLCLVTCFTAFFYSAGFSLVGKSEMYSPSAGSSFSKSRSPPSKSMSVSKGENILTSVGAYVVFVNELLLLQNHCFLVLDCPRLKLQIQQQLHILRLQEVILYYQLQVILDVFVLYSLSYRLPYRFYLLVRLKQLVFH